jgi:hypothetical protein
MKKITNRDTNRSAPSILVLNKESVRLLSSLELGGLVGGAPNPTRSCHIFCGSAAITCA